MAGGGRSISPQAASWAVLVLRCSAALLGLLAAACWLWAGTSVVQVQLVGDGGRDLRWWSLLPVALGIAVALLTSFAAIVRGRLGLLVIAALLVGLTGGAIAFGILVVPTPNPIHPLGSAVPYAFAGFLAAGAACLVTLLAVAVSGGWSAPVAERPTTAVRPRSAVVAALLAALLVAATGLVAVDRSRDYLLAANEYRTAGDVDRVPTAPPASTLTGGDRWQIEVPGLTVARPALTDYGIALASGQNVIMVDSASGATRWQYTRSDVAGAASVASTGDGRQVLAWWGPDLVYVLDARTGERVGHWLAGSNKTSILDAALPLIARTDREGRTTVVRMSSDGSSQWRYRLGVCEGARATAAGAVVVLTVSSSCGSRPGRTVALESATGSELWTSEKTPGDVHGIAGGAVILVSRPAADRPAGTLTAVDLDGGEIRWTQDLPMHGEQPVACGDLDVEAAAQVAVLVCTRDLTRYPTGPEEFWSTVHTYDLDTGSELQEVTYRTGAVNSTAVTADGRVLVARNDFHRDGWMLDVVNRESTQPSLMIVPGPIDKGWIHAITTSGDQVIVVDANTETLRSLR